MQLWGGSSSQSLLGRGGGVSMDTLPSYLYVSWKPDPFAMATDSHYRWTRKATHFPGREVPSEVEQRYCWLLQYGQPSLPSPAAGLACSASCTHSSSRPLPCSLSSGNASKQTSNWGGKGGGGGGAPPPPPAPPPHTHTHFPVLVVIALQ